MKKELNSLHKVLNSLGAYREAKLIIKMAQIDPSKYNFAPEFIKNIDEAYIKANPNGPFNTIEEYLKTLSDEEIIEIAKKVAPEVLNYPERKSKIVMLLIPLKNINFDHEVIRKMPLSEKMEGYYNYIMKAIEIIMDTHQIKEFNIEELLPPLQRMAAKRAGSMFYFAYQALKDEQFLSYLADRKLLESSEIDWRPDALPEDYYSF